MKKYFKYPAESGEGTGLIYLESEGESVIRQVGAFGGQLFWSDRLTQRSIEHRICDQPLSILALTPSDETTPEEFETVWLRAKQDSSEAS